MVYLSYGIFILLSVYSPSYYFTSHYIPQVMIWTCCIKNSGHLEFIKHGGHGQSPAWLRRKSEGVALPRCIPNLVRVEQFNPLSAGDAFKRIHTVFPQLKFDRN